VMFWYEKEHSFSSARLLLVLNGGRCVLQAFNQAASLCCRDHQVLRQMNTHGEALPSSAMHNSVTSVGVLHFH